MTPDQLTLDGVLVYLAIRGAGRVIVWDDTEPAEGGMTNEDGIALTGLSPWTYCPSRVELMQQGIVRNSGFTRPGRSGTQMSVWEAVE